MSVVAITFYTTVTSTKAIVVEIPTRCLSMRTAAELIPNAEAVAAVNDAATYDKLRSDAQQMSRFDTVKDASYHKILFGWHLLPTRPLEERDAAKRHLIADQCAMNKNTQHISQALRAYAVLLCLRDAGVDVTGISASYFQEVRPTALVNDAGHLRRAVMYIVEMEKKRASTAPAPGVSYHLRSNSEEKKALDDVAAANEVLQNSPTWTTLRGPQVVAYCVQFLEDYPLFEKVEDLRITNKGVLEYYVRVTKDLKLWRSYAAVTQTPQHKLLVDQFNKVKRKDFRFIAYVPVDDDDGVLQPEVVWRDGKRAVVDMAVLRQLGWEDSVRRDIIASPPSSAAVAPPSPPSSPGDNISESTRALTLSAPALDYVELYRRAQLELERLRERCRRLAGKSQKRRCGDGDSDSDSVVDDSKYDADRRVPPARAAKKQREETKQASSDNEEQTPDWIRIEDVGDRGQGVMVQREQARPNGADEHLLQRYPKKLLTRSDYDALDEEGRRLVLQIKGELRWVDLRGSWLAKINHASPSNANVEFQGHGLVQVKDIPAGSEMLVDYDLPYWVWMVTGVDIEDWKARVPKPQVEVLLKAFKIMHQTIDDYVPLLKCADFRSGTAQAVFDCLCSYIPAVNNMLMRLNSVQ